MNTSGLPDYFDSNTVKKDISLESYLENSESDSTSSSECSEVSLEGYSSSIDSDSDESCIIANNTESLDDKLVIFKFYKTLSVKLLKTFSVGYSEALNSVQHLMNTYRRVSCGNLPTEIDYTKKSNCIGYLQRYAACHAALVLDAISDIFDSSSSHVLLSKLNKKSLNVMFLGGGPGNDFVGFLTALFSHHYHLFDLDVTVVDKMSGWEDVFSETVENLRGGDCGKASWFFEEVNIMTTFIAVDLKNIEEWNKNMKDKMQNADIVFFIKALSHIPDGDKLQVLQNVVTSMKLESHLIYIDYPYPNEVFSSLSGYLRAVYHSYKTRYNLVHKDSAFGFSNIDSCRAVAKLFQRCENY
ncbi:unnamed protein product [Larinioides sclopetarius]|uniref:Uncharacterized protein n=1 Tax=Larinioides sclopetarius TaxID=280406 RepID=A0AAV1ZN88_9ARAC